MIAVDLALSTGVFANSVSMLGAVEEHTSLSRALSSLAAVEEKVDLLHVNQSESDFYIFSELIKDYIGIVQAIKVSFTESVVNYFVFGSSTNIFFFFSSVLL